MKSIAFLVGSCLVLQSLAQSVTLISSTDTAMVTSTAADHATSGITYQDPSRTLNITISANQGSTIDLSSTIAFANGTAAVSSSATSVNSSSFSATQTLLVGSSRTTTSLNGTVTRNQTSSATSTSARPTNTRPCNGFPEFCSRKYSNITHVAAHNSPFVRVGNIAANQYLDVKTQLNDGIRMRESASVVLCSIQLIIPQSNFKHI